MGRKMAEEDVHPAAVRDSGLEQEIREHRHEVTKDQPKKRIRNGSTGPPCDDRHANQRNCSSHVEVCKPVEPGLVGEIVEIQEQLCADRGRDSPPHGPERRGRLHGVTLHIVLTSFSRFHTVGSRVRYRTIPKRSTIA